MSVTAWAALIGSVALAGVLAWWWAGRRRSTASPPEPDRIEALDDSRHAELMRGTGLHLRELRYRYSVAADRSGRRAFSAEVNTIRIGFVPVTICENATDRRGPGYLAFVYDGRRWCGPGLPCAGNPEQALAHAARCVSPLAERRGDEGGA